MNRDFEVEKMQYSQIQILSSGLLMSYEAEHETMKIRA